MTSLLIISAILIILSAVCTSAEASLFSVNKIKIQILAEQGDQGAIRLLKLKTKMGNAIGTLVLLTNIFGIAGTLFLGGILKTAQAEAQIVNNVFISFFINYYEWFYTFFVIIFAETIPKNAGEKWSLRWAIFTTPLISFLSVVFTPILWILAKTSSLIIGNSKNTETASEEEVIAMTDLGLESNNIEKDEHEIIQNVFKMNDRSAKDIMTPRVQIDMLDCDLTLLEQKENIFKVEHSRLPVYGEDSDDVKGFVLLRDVLEELAKDNGHIKPNDAILLHKIMAVREDTKVDQLLIHFQRERIHIALVVDEYGGTSGVVSLEDVLEQLVGEIVDERDSVVDLQTEMNEHQGNIQMIG
jgi:CBS domain containing-hemolysin-like protein